MTGRGQLLAELERVARNCVQLLRMARPEHYGWRPKASMRTLAELANHMAQIPLVDLRIITAAKEEEVQAYERELWAEGGEAWAGLLREGNEQVRRHMEALCVDD